MKAQIVDGPFRKADYPIFPTLVQVYNLNDHPSNKEILDYVESNNVTDWPEEIGKGKTTSQLEMNVLDRFKIKDDIQMCINEYCFHAGTTKVDKKIYATGGRVLNFVCLSDNFLEARTEIKKSIKTLDWNGGFYRKDIGYKVINE